MEQDITKGKYKGYTCDELQAKGLAKEGVVIARIGKVGYVIPIVGDFMLYSPEQAQLLEIAAALTENEKKEMLNEEQKTLIKYAQGQIDQYKQENKLPKNFTSRDWQNDAWNCRNNGVSIWEQFQKDEDNKRIAMNTIETTVPEQLTKYVAEKRLAAYPNHASMIDQELMAAKQLQDFCNAYGAPAPSKSDTIVQE